MCGHFKEGKGPAQRGLSSNDIQSYNFKSCLVYISYANQKLIATVQIAVGGCTFCRFAYEGNFNMDMSKTSERHRAQEAGSTSLP